MLPCLLVSAGTLILLRFVDQQFHFHFLYKYYTNHCSACRCGDKDRIMYDAVIKVSQRNKILNSEVLLKVLENNQMPPDNPRDAVFTRINIDNFCLKRQEILMDFRFAVVPILSIATYLNSENNLCCHSRFLNIVIFF